MKKITVILLAMVMMFSMTAFAGETAEQEHKGTIMWLSNTTSGIQYEATVAYLKDICKELGYDFTIVYGDQFNDPAGNLQAVKNGFASDTKGLIVSQDGGLQAIMEEYPDLWVAGYNTDLRSVYDEDGTNAAVLENDHFLGTIVDGIADGNILGELMAQRVIEEGFKKVAIVNFPVFAYPSQLEADLGFRSTIEEYNASAEEPVEIVGETTTLMFEPLPDSWFLEEGKDSLDCIVAICHGMLFVYPTLFNAKANGFCSPETKMISGGFDNNADMVADIGEDKTINWIYNSPAEDSAYALILLDSAITGNLYEDAQPLRIDSAKYIIQSQEDIDNVMTKSMFGTGDPSLAQLSIEEAASLSGSRNSDMTQAELIEVFHSDQLSVDALKDR